jgi:DNA mismatch repair protein MutS
MKSTPATADAKARKSAAKSTSADTGATPAMRQYLDQKARVGEAILLFRMGDFYETFYEDAKTIAKVLGLTLTARDRNSASPIPLAGVPYHAVDRYVARLVAAGYKVAISEQMEDPKTAKGVVQRDVVRIITPGTLTDEALLEEKKDNLLAAVCLESGDWTKGIVGLAMVELSSGRFFAQMLASSDLADELARHQPAEVLLSEDAEQAASPIVARVVSTNPIPVSKLAPHLFDSHFAKKTLCDHFKVTGLSGFGFDRFDASLRAAAAVLEYLKQTQRAALAHIATITPRVLGDTVLLDQFTLHSLEVEYTIRDRGRDGSLLGAVDMTVSAMGARLLREWLCSPLRNVETIRARQDAIASVKSSAQIRRTVRDLLGDSSDIQRILARLALGRASPRDLVGLGRTLGVCTQLSDAIRPLATSGPDAGLKLAPADPTSSRMLAGLSADLGGHQELADYIAGALNDDAPAVTREGGFIRDGHDAELDRLRTLSKDSHRYLAEYQAREAQRTGISALKVGYNSVFGYYIEVTHQHRDRVPSDYIRKQTVRNAERYITEELKRHESDVLGATERSQQLELKLFDDIRNRIATNLTVLQAAANALAALDVLAALAELSAQRNYCRPEFVADAVGLLDIEQGRHPVLDATLASSFVPNNCTLSRDKNFVMIITGPNMAGKSTYIRQTALLALLAHTGSDVPAKSMRLAPVDRIFARVGASDELSRGQSTFMVEMVETSRILNTATEHSLVILDEIGRGTSTYDGLAIAWAVTEHLAKRVACRALFATHYHELTEIAARLPGVSNFNVAVREELRPTGAGRDVVFLHQIVPGPADRSYGIHVAAMAGLPGSVVRRAEKLLVTFEQNFERRSKAEVPAVDSDQLPLFQDAAPQNEAYHEIVDALQSMDISQIRPIDALKLLEELQRLIASEPGKAQDSR